MQDTRLINGFFLKDILKENTHKIPLFLQGILILVVILVAALAYVIPHAYVKSMIGQHYESMSEKTMHGISYRLDDLDIAQETVARILSLPDPKAAFATFNDGFSDLSSLHFFNSIILIKPVPNLNTTAPITVKIDTLLTQRNSVTLNKDNTIDTAVFTPQAVTALSENKALARGHSIVFKTMPALSLTAKPNSFFLMQALNANALEEGYLLITVDLNTVFKKSWFDAHEHISHLALRNLATGEELFNANRKSPRNHAQGNTQIYDFVIGEQKVEVKVDFTKDDTLLFLEFIPLLFSIFGAILAGVLVFYLNYNLQESSKRKAIHQSLAEKEDELNKEMSQREQLILALGNAEKDNRAIINSVSDIIFEVDGDARLVFINKRWGKVTGFDAPKSIGLDLFGFIQPQDQEDARHEFRKLCAGAQTNFRRRSRLRMADDRYRTVELSISIIEPENNERKRIIGTFTDIEDRRRAERALGEAEKKYRAIVENAAGGIFQLAPSGMYLSVNRAMARILGYSKPEAILRGIKNAHTKIYVNPREREKFLKELEVRGSMSNFETQVYRKDGAIIWVNENVRVVRDDAGKTLYYEGSIEDITLRKKSDLSLREAKMKSDMANRAKSEFLANMSHELRTPLNAIIGFSEIIKTEAFGPIAPPNYLEYATDIHDSGSRLLQIINEILDISKIEAGERSLNESIVDIEEVVHACLVLANNKPEDTQISITNTLNDVPKLIAEEVAIKQIMLNLLTNAIKFTPAGGRITLSSELDPHGSLQLSISDTGIGLDDAEIQKALSPFGQIQNELSRSNSGTGLGLTLVDALVKLHGGRLEIFSQKGIGTTVTIVFPASRLTVK